MECAFSLTGEQMSTVVSTHHAWAAMRRARAACGPGDADHSTPLAQATCTPHCRLAQHDPSLVEAWRGPEPMEPGPRGPVAQLAADIAALQRRRRARGRRSVSAPRSRHDCATSRSSCDALRFAADRQLGRATSIDEQAEEEFGSAFAAARRCGRAADARRDRDRLLPGQDTLADRVNALARAASAVPRDRKARGHARPRSRRAGRRQRRSFRCRPTSASRSAFAVASMPDGTRFARYAGDIRTRDRDQRRRAARCVARAAAGVPRRLSRAITCSTC